jgi:SOS-response transcriptional repressor LexA
MTPEMRRTLTIFQDHYAAHGVAPTFREVAKIEGLASVQSVHRRVHALVAAGLLVKGHGHSRSYLPAGPDLTNVPTDQLRTELAKREKQHG